MITNAISGIDAILQALSAEVDITDAAFEDATSRYKAIGTWLSRPTSTLAAFQPDIYPQGSINLGTVVRPWSDHDHYDIDLVCQLSLKKEHISQEALKKLIGFEVQEYAKANRMLQPPSEGRRCWTLEYAAGARFHLDILPSIPDAANFQQLLEQNGMSVENLHRLSIAITDNTHLNFRTISDNWPVSNPKGYAEWFKQRMATQLNEQRRKIAESQGKQLDEVPDDAVKTTLQRAIQLLKRHRDLMFKEKSDEKPISVIITTLAALAYGNEPNLGEALINIIRRMRQFIEFREEGIWIPNPVNPLENFADRWATEPQRNEYFYDWLSAVQRSLQATMDSRSSLALNETLAKNFGEAVVERAVTKTLNDGVIQSITFAPDVIGSTTVDSRLAQTHRLEPVWPMTIMGDVTVNAKLQHGKSWFNIVSDSSAVPKHRKIRFKATPNITGPFDVYWQVVNTGEEARNARGLRGEILRSDSLDPEGIIRQESTLYRGMHWIECFIVKHGYCVARSEPFIINIR